MPSKFDFATITEAADVGAQRFILYGPPKIGKTQLVCNIPGMFIICPEEGLKGIDKPAKHFPRAPRNIAELYEAIDAFVDGNVKGPDGKKPFHHLAIDTLSWVESMINAAACTEERVKHMAGKEYQAVWQAAVAIWEEFYLRLERVRRSGVHWWALTHGEQIDDVAIDGSTWRKWDLKLYKKASAIWRERTDHVLFMNWGSKAVKGGKGKRTVGKYDGRVVYLRESADHFAGSRSSAPEQVPATWPDLRAALAAPAPATDAKLRAAIVAVLEVLDVDSKAAIEKDLAVAKNGRDLAAVLSRAEGFRSIAVTDAPEEEDEAAAPLAEKPADDPPVPTTTEPSASAKVVRADAEEAGNRLPEPAGDEQDDDEEESAPAPLDASAPAATPSEPKSEPPPASSPRPTAAATAMSPSSTTNEVKKHDTAPVEDDQALANRLVDEAVTMDAVKKAFLQLSKLKLSMEERQTYAEALNKKKKSSFVGAA